MFSEQECRATVVTMFGATGGFLGAAFGFLVKTEQGKTIGLRELR